MLSVALDLNMSACKLQLKDYTGALAQARMALQLMPTSCKAHYRAACAHLGLGAHAEARASLAQCAAHDPTGVCARDIARQRAVIAKAELHDRDSVRAYTKQLEVKMKKEAAKQSGAFGGETIESEVPAPVEAPTAPVSVECELAESLRTAHLRAAEIDGDDWNVDTARTQPPVLSV
jgi:hypothetical protein